MVSNVWPNNNPKIAGILYLTSIRFNKEFVVEDLPYLLRPGDFGDSNSFGSTAQKLFGNACSTDFVIQKLNKKGSKKETFKVGRYLTD